MERAEHRNCQVCTVAYRSRSAPANSKAATCTSKCGSGKCVAGVYRSGVEEALYLCGAVAVVVQLLVWSDGNNEALGVALLATGVLLLDGRLARRGHGIATPTK